MKAVEFCYWLQGFFELQGKPVPPLNADQAVMIQRHLAMVFKHDIDPSYGSQEHQAELNTLHNAGKVNHPFKPPPQPPVAHDHIHPGDVLMRC